MPRLSTRATAPALFVVSALALAGCATGAQTTAGDGRLQIVATTTQMGDVVRHIVGDEAEVTQLLRPGQSAHSFDPTPQALQELATADVLVENGAGLESWLDDTIESSGFDGVLVDASADVHLHEAGDEEAHAHEHEESTTETDAAHADEAHSDEATAEDAHDHGAFDPHVWSDPHQVVHMAETIGAALAEADPERAEAIEQGTTEYVAQLDALDTWALDSIAQVPEAERLLVTNHDTFSYLAEAAGITIVGSVMPSFDDDAEPSAADIDALVAAIRETGVRAVFSETSIDPQLAATIAEDAGVEVLGGEDALYADSLGAAGSAGETYVGSVIHNVTLIVESWGAEPLPLPDSLQS